MTYTAHIKYNYFFETCVRTCVCVYVCIRETKTSKHTKQKEEEEEEEKVQASESNSPKSTPAFDLSSYAISPRIHHFKLTGNDITNVDRNSLEKYMATRREEDVKWYNRLLSKTKKYGKHYYSKRYENEGLDAFRRHITLRVDHDHNDFASERLGSTTHSQFASTIDHTHTGNTSTKTRTKTKTKLRPKTTQMELKKGMNMSFLTKPVTSENYEDKYIKYLYSGNTRKKKNPLLDAGVLSLRDPVEMHPLDEKEREAQQQPEEDDKNNELELSKFLINIKYKNIKNKNNKYILFYLFVQI
ncbi:hypothetical protein RFI_19423 [Reticulomyxa filosa]|uniref:Uncharacterized protein n=1 Tax=Reticulomyxa filosa TaxID=46433 RepID=X6MWQ0_RETFI|nr:hypothetical protein RFI_19423 [Reticulomyxa filosa]|eukprot:ETO17882.1 hypothetical protein RFI_19423 [Reticulomyxa filosa]